LGNLTRYVDRDGRTTFYTYDAYSRRTSEQWLEGSPDKMAIVYETDWHYDTLGRLTNVITPDSRYAYTYDTLDELVSVDNGGTYGSPDVKLTYTYDAYGRRTQLSATINGVKDLKNTYSYNDTTGTLILTQGSQSGGTIVLPKRVELATNTLGQTSSITRYAATTATNLVATTTYTYDALDRLSSIMHVGSDGTIIDGYTYGYDAASRITSFDSVTDGLTSYTYDATNQLIGATSAATTWTYSYDANGNRTMAGYVTGLNNETLSDGTYTYTYDAEGNMTSKTRISDASADDYQVMQPFTGRLTRYDR
jgi:YD repeat-containing protein